MSIFVNLFDVIGLVFVGGLILFAATCALIGESRERRRNAK